MVLSIGEILVDVFVDGNKKTVHPGGAPFNVASNIIHYDGQSSFYGVVGNDEYGKLLLDYIKKNLPNSYIDVLDDKKTTEAIVTLVNGERSFKFNRDNGADYLLDINKLKEFDLNKISIVHLGSLMLCYRLGRDFFYKTIQYIRENSKCLISFDVNYRDDIFRNKIEAKFVFTDSLKYADIVKFSKEELKLLTGHEDVADGLKSLLNQNQMAVVTLGKDGSIFYKRDKYIEVSSIPLDPVDTTGAGDAFYSYFLYMIDQGLDLNDDEQIINALTRANVAGALATQKKGAIDVVPSNHEIDKFLRKNN